MKIPICEKAVKIGGKDMKLSDKPAFFNGLAIPVSCLVFVLNKKNRDF